VRLSQEAVVEAALRVVDAEGVDAVTMRRVGQELGTGAASLYAHVADKDELLALVFDRVVGEIDLSVPDAHWTEAVKAFPRRWRTALLAHRDLAKVNLGTVPTGPNAMRGMEGMLAVLHGAGLPNRVVGYAVDLIGQFVTAATYEASLWQARMSSPQAENGDDRFEFGLDILIRGLATHLPPEPPGRPRASSVRKRRA
jgi:AcrR family transcriptional regulator